MSRPDIEAYLASLGESGHAPFSIRRVVSAIRGFHRFMLLERLCDSHPAANLVLPKRSERLPDVISRKEAFELLDAPFAQGKEPRPQARKDGVLDYRGVACFYRDKAILELLYGCGLRVSELCGLDLRDVCLDEEMLRVVGKGSKERLVPILGTAKDALTNYLNAWRATLAARGNHGPAVFLSVRGSRITRQAVHALVERYGRYVGIKERVLCPDTTVELLIPDMQGREDLLDIILAERPDVLNHNVETVPSLYFKVRPQANFERSLAVLRYAKEKGFKTKSGIMVGLGEREDEVIDVMKRLREGDCDMLTVGQYLQPTSRHIAVHEYVTPETFEFYRVKALELGFARVASGPFVRSSYKAEAL